MEQPPVTHDCYPSIRHDDGDVIKVRDCVLVKSGPRKKDIPFIGKVASFWQSPDNGGSCLELCTGFVMLCPCNYGGGLNIYVLNNCVIV